MQFKIVSVLTFAILAAANTLPQVPPVAENPVPHFTNPPPPTHPNLHLGRVNTNLRRANVNPPCPGNPTPTIGGSQCPTGKLQCCQTAQSPTATAVTPILQFFGFSASDISGYVGINCTQITATDSCSTQAACCTDNTWESVASFGCNLVNLGS